MTRSSDSTLHEEPAPADALTTENVELRVIASPDSAALGQRVLLSRDEPLLLGRKVERGGMSIDDPRMSRTHARIGWDGRASAFRIGDAGSANGVYVNGVRATVATLEAGTVIRTAGTLYVVVVGDPVARLHQRLEAVARADLTVLLTGETGTGKELLAQQLHEESERKGPFLAVNCAALPRELLVSELFGHTRAAFSGAAAERQGLFRAARGGTLFLDEIGDMPLEHQPVLLRVLQEKSVRPVGSERELPTDVRVVAATHRDLSQSVDEGSFRLDLHARLAEVELRAPPLRERRHTLPDLIRTIGARLGIEPRVTTEAMELLALGRWPQNVRELAALLNRLKLFGAPAYELNRAFLAQEAPHLLASRDASVPPPLGNGPEITRELLEASLARHQHRVAEVARELDTSRTQVYRWLKRFGLDTPSGRR
ncbi:MAG: Response regulator of zinc sigma-54-dependent two-component system [Polyangiaceae bacterium]|jgi:transcriptional regulator with GAF, ATPase, and Fis domain|nr:Response regulator of zinc sigma-54-dependent two-component system [Polyangiaceae bacterium]